MQLVLMILSVLAAWLLHAVLIAGLLAILQQLEGVRRSLEQITMGVRAIEQQTIPLGERAEELAISLQKASKSVGTVAERLEDVNRGLDGAGPALRGGS